MISFDTLTLIKRAEEKGELSKLPPNFQEDVNKYFDSLDKDDIEYENAKKVLQKILEKRRWKILKLAIAKVEGGEISTEKMLPPEADFFYLVVKGMSKLEKNFLKADKVEKGKVKKEEKESMMVRFLTDIPAFVGFDGLGYGPFRKDDKKELPRDIGRVIVKKGEAKEV